LIALVDEADDAFPPYEVEHLWHWFCDLSAVRTGSGFGANPIGYGEIEAWARLTGNDPTPWEVSVLRRMDIAALEKFAKKAPKTAGGKKKDQKQASEQIKPDDWQAIDKMLNRLG
jgi:hypothetical protein